MNITDAIQILRKHSTSGASVLRITEGKVTEHELLDYVLNACDQFIAEREEYKRLLKAAVEDFAFVSDNFINTMDSFCSMYNHISGCVEGCPMNSSDDYGRCKWRYADEAEKLIES